MADFPESCLRGLRKKDYLTLEGFVSVQAFKPDTRTVTDRKDGGSETSINWEDNKDVLGFTFNQRTESGNVAHPFGVSRLPLQKIDQVNSEPGSKHALNYERAPLEDNPYHGNVVFKAGLSKLISCSLALAAQVLHP
ncbi:MAG: hypothetical protein O3B01_13660 [Planctomycetota bacterium]|nr:hypothetical protein [Planctomycetota bacterium]MDA1139620.1 hypothetical protein [Planctomycetota bacterium]